MVRPNIKFFSFFLYFFCSFPAILVVTVGNSGLEKCGLGCELFAMSSSINNRTCILDDMLFTPSFMFSVLEINNSYSVFGLLELKTVFVVL